MNRIISLGIIGAGRVSGAHARSAAALQRTRVAGVAEVDTERRERFAREYACPGFERYEELLEQPGIDAVVVVLPHWLHAEVTIAALEAGKHVLLEKPMAMTVAECDAMIAAEKRAGRRLMVGHSQHFFPVNLAVRSLIDAGEIGRVVMATDTWCDGSAADKSARLLGSFTLGIPPYAHCGVRRKQTPKTFYASWGFRGSNAQRFLLSRCASSRRTNSPGCVTPQGQVSLRLTGGRFLPRFACKD